MSTWKVIGFKTSLHATQLMFAFLLIYTPIQLSEQKTQDYPILNRLFNVDSKEVNRVFLYTMQWLLTTEPFIYTIGKNTRSLLSSEFLDAYGIHKEQ